MQNQRVYFPEVFHGGEAPEGGGISTRQRRVQEELRHDFVVVVHVCAHHPICYCNTKEKRNYHRTDFIRNSFFPSYIQNWIAIKLQACFSQKDLGVFGFFLFFFS